MVTESSVTRLLKRTAAAIGATGTPGPDSAINARSLPRVSDSGPTDVVASDQRTGVKTATEATTGTLVVDTPLVVAGRSGADNHSTVVTRAPDPDPATAPIDVVSGLLSAVGVGSPLSTVDGPVAPLPGVIVVGSLDLVRRDLERMNDDRLAADTQRVTTNTLILDTPSNDSPASGLGGHEVPTAVATPNERAAALVREQAERISALFDKQAELISALFDRQVELISRMAQELPAKFPDSSVGALVRTQLLAVAEAVQRVGYDAVEAIYVAQFAVTEHLYALADHFVPPVGGGGGAGTGSLYGDPEKNAQYWQAQSHGNNCVLMATTMVIGQLTGTMPSEEDIVKEASETESVAKPGQMMYLGPTHKDGVHIQDAVALLDRHGVTATTTEYDRADGMKALDDLTMALAANKAVMVGVHGETIWNAVEGKPLPEGVTKADHQVVILGVDRIKNIVYINDSGFAEEGKNMKVPLGVFMKAWQTDDYETTVAERKQPATSTPGPESHRISNSGVLLDVA
ncbi:hypothetical protein AU193_16560 [Mycobacterium sp. GA-1285]|nr:hypothetical protein AU193_16560 [Mycobacterium sp. GA-1285]